jgi:hypothetical protein
MFWGALAMALTTGIGALFGMAGTCMGLPVSSGFWWPDSKYRPMARQ